MNADAKDFSDLGLDSGILSTVQKVGYAKPTPIQVQAIPVALAKRDLVGIAQTGTGKTASFTLPMIQQLTRGRARARMPRSLILEPTRELAMQVAENFDLYGGHTKLTKALLIGGIAFDSQDRLLDRGVDVLIATPGRLLDHMQRGKVLLRGVEIFVIDEADRMLDMGFIPDIERIVKYLSLARQTLLFSATMPPEIQSIAERFLRTPERIEVAPPASVVKTVSQYRVPCAPAQKLNALHELLQSETIANAIIFCNRKRDIGSLLTGLTRLGHQTISLHGDMDQYRRMDMLEQFRKQEVRFLIASDVAARGLDIPQVSHVFNYDVPTHPEDYVHRIGRTGRAGKSGKAFMLITPDEQKYLEAIESLIGQTIPHMEGTPQGGAAERAPRADNRRADNREDDREDDRAGRSPRHRTTHGDHPREHHGERGERRHERRARAPQERRRHRGGRRRGWTAAPDADSLAAPDSGPESRHEPRPESRPASRPENGTAAPLPEHDSSTGFGSHVPNFLRQ